MKEKCANPDETKRKRIYLPESIVVEIYLMGFSLREVAKMFHCSSSVIYKLIRKNGVNRTVGESHMGLKISRRNPRKTEKPLCVHEKELKIMRKNWKEGRETDENMYAKIKTIKKLRVNARKRKLDDKIMEKVQKKQKFITTSADVNLHPYGRGTDKDMRNADLNNWTYVWDIKGAKYVAPHNREIKAQVHEKHNSFIDYHLDVEMMISLPGMFLKEHEDSFSSSFLKLKNIYSFETDNKVYLEQKKQLVGLSKTKIFNTDINEVDFSDLSNQMFQYLDLHYTNLLTDKSIDKIMNLLFTNRDLLSEVFALSVCFQLMNHGRKGHQDTRILEQKISKKGHKIISSISDSGYMHKGAHREMNYTTLIIQKTGK